MALDPKNLPATLPCIDQCIPDGMKQAVIIYLLNLLNDTLSGSISITAYDPRGDLASAPTVNTTTTALALNAERRSAKIRNLSTSPMYVRYGAGATSAVGGYDEALGGANTQDDWESSQSIEVFDYTGVITVAGADLRYIATEMYHS